MPIDRRSLVLTAIVALSSAATSAEAADNMTLIDAMRANDLSAIRRLIAQGVPLDDRDAEQRTALLLATRADNVEAAKLLIEAGADVNAKDGIKDTPFLYAGAEGRNEILSAILATGRANLRDTNRYGGVALIPAAHHGHPETVCILLGTVIDIDHVNDLGWTALLEAVILSDGGPIHQEIVGLLVDASAKGIPDRDGVTPLEHARRRGYTEMAARIEAGPR